MVTQQLQQVATTDVTQHLHGSAGATHAKQGPRVQRFLPQQSVSGGGLPVYPHPPTYQTNGRQNSMESRSSSIESGGSQLSRLEAHQMALMHPNDQGKHIIIIKQ